MDIIKTYTNISWLPKEAKIDIILTDKITQELGSTTSVFSFIFDSQKKQILLLKHTDTSRGYDIPGGHIETGETPIEALHREILEETGAIVKNIKMIGVQRISKLEPEPQYPDLISHQAFFVSELIDITDIELAPDSQGIQILNISEYNNLLNNPSIYIKELFEEALKI
jgi:8-oxo-dGTP pyrophosphatase MutT (NUDIX family)